MSTTTAEQEGGWRKTIAEHPRSGCPTCRQRNCWEQAYAREQLITRGLPTTPPTDDRTHPTAG